MGIGGRSFGGHFRRSIGYWELIPRAIGCREKINQNSYTGFKIIEKTILEQHLIARGRENNIIAIQKKFPDYLGIGIDEGTALVINGNLWEVIGNSKVILFWPQQSEEKNRIYKVDTTHLNNGSKFINSSLPSLKYVN